MMAMLLDFVPAAGATGYLFVSDHKSVLGGIMPFASGGILYLTFQDIAPQAHLALRWAPSLGAVVGFLLGLLGKLLI